MKPDSECPGEREPTHPNPPASLPAPAATPEKPEPSSCVPASLSAPCGPPVGELVEIDEEELLDRGDAEEADAIDEPSSATIDAVVTPQPPR